jgi:hypothetical protein
MGDLFHQVSDLGSDPLFTPMSVPGEGEGEGLTNSRDAGFCNVEYANSETEQVEKQLPLGTTQRQR